MIIFYCKARHTRHHHNARNRKPKNRFSSQSFQWLLIGLFFGMLGSTTLYWFFNGNWSLDKVKLPIQANKKLKIRNEKLEKTAAVPQAHAVPQVNILTQKKAMRQRFEFYQLLPGMEVPIPDDHATGSPRETSKFIATRLSAKSFNLPAPLTPSSSLASQKKLSSVKSTLKPKNKPVKIQTKLAAAQYLIQVGTYRTFHSAETLKFQLAAKGFKPRLQKIETEEGIWFRVTLGPFPSETMALHQRNRLAKQQIHGILILQRQ